MEDDIRGKFSSDEEYENFQKKYRDYKSFQDSGMRELMISLKINRDFELYKKDYIILSPLEAGKENCPCCIFNFKSGLDIVNFTILN